MATHKKPDESGCSHSGLIVKDPAEFHREVVSRFLAFFEAFEVAADLSCLAQTSNHGSPAPYVTMRRPGEEE